MMALNILTLTPEQKAALQQGIDAAGGDPAARRALRRLDWLARGRVRGGSIFPEMASPPVVTAAPTTSTLIASTNYGSIPVPHSDARLTYAGSGSVEASGFRVGTGTSGIDGTAAGQLRVRFMTDAPAFEVVCKGLANQRINAVVDGEYASRGAGIPQSINSGQALYVKFDFGTDAPFLFYSQVTRIANGTGYALGDVVTVDVGTFTRPAKLRVIQLTGGGVATFAVEDGGAYSVLPAGSGGAFTTTALTGSGSGATFGTPIISKGYTTRRMRRIELILDSGVQFRGIVIRPQDTLLAWPVSTRGPRTMVIGDSQNAGTYLGFPGGNMSYGWLQRLGLWDQAVLSANGGTGWVTANGNAAPWSHSNRVADVIAQAPDLLVYDGSQNDGASTAVQAAALATLNAVLTALPALRVVLVGPVIGGTADYMAQLAGAAAACTAPGRVRMIDNIAEGWITAGSGTVTAPTGSGNRDHYMSSDSAHLVQAGTEMRATVMAERILTTLQDMVSQ